MQVNSKKDLRRQKIERLLKTNLKKRKIFQNKLKKKKNERFIRPLD